MTAPTLKDTALDAELIDIVYAAGGEREYFVGNDGLKHAQWTFMPDELVKFVALIREGAHMAAIAKESA
tara:strand:- start:57 stop:263 length:207 start_codon:yes stop_codon:yes gene_type:complete